MKERKADRQIKWVFLPQNETKCIITYYYYSFFVSALFGARSSNDWIEGERVISSFQVSLFLKLFSNANKILPVSRPSIYSIDRMYFPTRPTLSAFIGPTDRSTSNTRPNFSHPSSRFAVVYQSFCSRMIADRLYYDWIAGKNLVE